MLSQTAVADTWMPFTNYRSVDATGQYYVVVKRADPKGVAETAVPVAFEIAERRPGSAPVDWANEPSRNGQVLGVKPESVKAREGDVVVGKGTLDRAPRCIATP
jgi:hypothetical protein